MELTRFGGALLFGEEDSPYAPIKKGLSRRVS